MTREELRTGLYNETGEWCSDEQLNEYIGFDTDGTEDENYSNDRTNYTGNKTSNSKSYLHFSEEEEDDEALLGDDLVSEVNDMFTMVLKKAKTAFENKKGKIEVKQLLEEFEYFGKLFLLKSLIYFTLQQGKEKGFMWKSL